MFQFEMISNNIDDGYPEACCRALNAGFLREEDYNQLINCGNLAEFKLVLDETDYKNYIVSHEGGPLDIIWLKKQMQQKLRDEIEYLMGQASDPLASFLEQMMHLYQIENVVSFIGGAKAKMDPAITLQGMNPLGEF